MREIRKYQLDSTSTFQKPFVVVSRNGSRAGKGGNRGCGRLLCSFSLCGACWVVLVVSIGKMRFEWGTSANFTQLEDIKTLTRVSKQKELVLGNVHMT